MMNLGITVPLSGVPVRDLHRVIAPLLQEGVTELWSSETAEFDAFSPLVAVAQHAAPSRVGTAIAGVHLRGPALLAMETAGLLAATPTQTRVALGLGVGSEAIVKRWNGLPFERHIAKMEATIEFVKSAVSGHKVSSEYLGVTGFQLAAGDLSDRLEIVVAALRPRMLQLAAECGTGAVTNWLTATDMAAVRAVVASAGAPDEFDLIVRVPVFVTDNPEDYTDKVNRSITTYLNVPTYADFQRWLGHGAAFDEMWEAWDSGDRKASLSAVPQHLASGLLVVGDESHVANGLASFYSNGATTVVPAILPWGDVHEQVERLGAVLATLTASGR